MSFFAKQLTQNPSCHEYMLSRRNIRIKVMQILYMLSRDKELTFKEALRRYEQGIEESYILYLYNLNYFVRLTKHALRDAERRSAKHLPTEEDKGFTPKLFQNDIVQKIANHEEFTRLVDGYKFDDRLDDDTIRKLYIEFSKTKDYKNYLTQDTAASDHLQILLALFKYCNGSELYNESIEDHYPTWYDDKSLVVGTIKKTLKGKPGEKNFIEVYKPTAETTEEFGEALLDYVFNKDKELLGVIEPTLNNWDVDRVAVIDMILLKMAVAELMIFSSIPTKVTLNEFVEISKMYSTDKSKDFINGILDRLMKELEKDGRIKKEGRGLIN